MSKSVVRQFLGLGVISFLNLSVQADQSIYTDTLQNGWQNWGWTQIDYANSSPVHSGTKSIAVTITNNTSQAIYIAYSAFDSTPYLSISFWINGGPVGGQKLLIQGHAAGASQMATNLPTLAANTWQHMTFLLSDLGVANRSDMDGFWIQDRIDSSQPTFYLDDITLVTNANPLPSIVLAAPLDGASYLAPAAINLAATVTTNGHSISKVQFYSGANLLNEDSATPYSFAWTNVGVGTNSLFARLVYDSGNTLDSSHATVTIVTNSPVSINVDALRARHLISPLIYGVAFASAAQLVDLNAPLNRSGGNSETRYNWQLNAHNHAADWYFESLDDGPTNAAASADQFVLDSRNGGAQPMLTIPMLGWVPKLGPSRARLSSFSIPKYGLQTDHDWQWFPDAGNGVVTNSSTFIAGNDPNDANSLTNSIFQEAFVQHLTNAWGLSTNGGVPYYLMDNEHTIWHSTHRDVHPVGTTMQEIRDKFFDYAGRVKSIDPSALVLAPEEWGWSGYFYSGYDQQWAGANGDYYSAHFPDRGTNAGWDYLPWLLDQFRQRATNTNLRLLDYLTVHYYPQSGEFGNDISSTMQLTRNRSTRSLWDTNYVDTSWIGSVVKLIPRLRSWVAAYYPGTKIGITEYNWGAEGHMNGATAQADILGIFGREGLDVGTRWTTPDASTPTYRAMKLYRNYDGNKSTFGDTSISAAVPNPDALSAFAALRSSDGALTTMVINKSASLPAPVVLNLTNFLHNGMVQAWQLTSTNPIAHLSDATFVGNRFSSQLPAQSITLFVFPTGGSPLLRAGLGDSNNTLDLWLDGQSGQRYVIQAATDLVNWSSLQTNTLASNSLHMVFPATNLPGLFFRALWAP